MTREQFIALHATSGILGDESAVKLKLAYLAGEVYDSLKFKGTKTNAQVAALTPANGDTYRIITTGGDLNGGALTTVVGNVITYDEPNAVWVLLAAS